MGNAESSSSTGTVPNTQKIKLKSGSKASCIPSPHSRDAATYEKILKNGEFKDFMYQHLDSDYLIGAILQGFSDDAEGDRQLLEGISVLNVVNNSDLKNEYTQSINNYQNLVESGINVRIKDSLSHVEKELDVRSTYKVNPFIKSFHKRLAALKSLEDCIVNEKMVAIEHKKRRQYAFNHLNSASHPQLLAIEGLTNTGLLLLQQFPVFYPLLSSNADCLPMLTKPVTELCDSFVSLNDLNLFSAWAPAPKSPLKQLGLKKSTATASSGTAADAVDSISTTCWSSTKPRSTWSIQLEEPSTISAIRIAWAPLTLAVNQPQSAGFAPKRVTLKICESTADTTYTKVLVIDPVVEWKRQGTWNQVYQVNRTNVAAIQVFCVKYCQFNASATIKMYDFEVLMDDKEAKWVNTADLLVSLQVSLLPILDFDAMWSIVLDSLLSLIRSSGSLSLTLRLIKYLYEHEKALDMKVKSHGRTGEQISRLLKAYQVENNRVIESISSSHSGISKVRKDVVFDVVTKTAGVTLSGDNMVATTQAPTASTQYCLFNTCMEKGLWEWELVITRDMLQATCLGVAKLLITNNKYESSSDMWVVRCVDGELFHGGRSKNDAITAIHVDDVCRFSYDSDALTLSMSVNGVDQGVIFEQVPNCVAPFALFYGNDHVVNIVSVSYRDSTKRELPPDFDKLASSYPAIDVDAMLSGSGPTVVETLLQHVAALAATRMYQIECALTDTGVAPEDSLSLQSLEYPYCIELSIGTVQLLTSLLELFTHDMKRNRVMITCCLQLLDAHFIVLNHTNLDLADVGFKYKSDDGKIVFDADCAHVVRESVQVLQALRQSSDEVEVRVAACKAFARGSSLFLPNGYDKIDLCLSIINESLDRNSGLGKGQLDEATSVLLEMLVHTLSQYEQIIKLIEIFKDLESSRHTIQSLLTYLLSLIAGHTIEKLVDTEINTLTVMKHEKFRKTIVTLFVRLQEQLVHYLLASKPDTGRSVVQELFILYSKKVIHAAIPVFEAAHAAAGLAHSVAESYLRDSMIMHILQPLVHSFCFFTTHFPILQGILPNLVFLLQRLTELCKKSPRCTHAMQLLHSSIPSDMNKPPKVGVSGWKTIKAQFEDNQSSYSVSDNGTMYTSVHSNNTCGIINTPFGKNSRAAWEFQLESDTLNDECSVFGAARIPESPGTLNRCYSTSPDLWMRRAYNGYMYVQGRTTGNNMEKIHPSDVIRIEFDGKAGTLSFSVNGSEPEVGFTDIAETVYPACGSYRANVAIKLLKVEVFSSDETESEEGETRLKRAQWNLDPDRMSTRDPTVLIPLKTEKKEATDAGEKNSWVTARTTDAVTEGVHEWTFEIIENSKNPFALGVVSGDPYSKDRLAGPCYEDVAEKGTGVDPDASTPSNPPIPPAEPSSATDPVTVQQDETPTAAAVPPPTQSTGMMPARQKAFLYPEAYIVLSWNSDGSLWVNGVRKATDFGKKFLPLNPLTSVTIRIDRVEHTVSYLVNGSLVGVAFGPETSGARVAVPLDPFKSLYPAASVSTPKQSIKIKQTGFNGSLTLPIPILMQKTCSATIGRLVSALACGPAVDKQESLLMPWLQSPLLIGGVDDTTTDPGNAGGSWDEAWNELSTGNAAESMSLKPPKAEPEAIRYLEVFLNEVALCQAGSAEGSDVLLLLNWLESIDKEPLFMRQAMEKIGTYSFPACEMPILACLLKHSGLVVEAVDCCRKLKLQEAPEPSPNMVTLWKKMRQIRVNLRKERQRFKESVNAPSETAVSTTPTPVALTTVPAATDTASSSASRQLDIISAADMQVPMGVFLSEHIVWRTQSPDTTSIYSPTYQCTVLAVGVDFVNEYLFIRFCVRGDLSMGELQAPSDSTLHVDDSQIDDSDQNLAQETPAESPREILGTLRYDMSNHPDFAATINDATVQFEYGGGGYIPVTLQLPANNEAGLHVSPVVEDLGITAAATSAGRDDSSDSATSTQDDAVITPNSFEDYCALLASRAQFLLSIHPSENYSDSSAAKSKDLILDLLDRFTSSAGTPLSSSQSLTPRSNSSFKLVRMKSHDGTERWGRVLEFVKGNSKLRRQLSSSNYPSNEVDADAPGESNLVGDETISPVVAAIQACSLFITLTEKFISSAALTGVMSKRSARAAYRVFAFDALYTILKGVDISTDPMLLEDQLLFLRQALRDTTAYAKPDAALLNKEHNAHYLVNLEGCNAATLTHVQESFLKVFSVVSNVTSQYLSTWDTLSTSNCYGCLLAEGDATSDAAGVNGVHSLQKTLMKEINASNAKVLVPPLRLMLSIWSLNFSTRDCLFLLKCGILPSLQRLTSFATLEKVTQTWYDVAEKLASVGSNYGHKSGKCCLWSNQYVVEGLKSGSLSCRAVLLHLYLIPRNVLTTSERVAFGLNRDFKDLCINLGVTEVSLLYQRVWLVVQKKNKDIQKDELLKKQKLADAASKVESEVAIQMAACGTFDPLHSSRQITLSDHNLVAACTTEAEVAVCALATGAYDCDAGATDSGNYFEVEILSRSPSGGISIGLHHNDFSADGFVPGFAPGSYSYNALNGERVYDSSVTTVWPVCEVGDVVGCGFAMDRSTVFFTHNGTLLGEAFTQVRERALHPVVGFSSGGESATGSVRINFGVQPFRYTSSDVHAPLAVADVRVAQENARKQMALLEFEGSASKETAAESVETKELMEKQREKYMRNLESCDAYLHEYHSLRSYSITLLKYFTMLACKVNEVNGDGKKSAEDPASNDSKLLPPKLIRGVSTFGTPKIVTSIDGTVLEENLIKLLTEYFVLGSKHLMLRPDMHTVTDPDLAISRSINSFRDAANSDAPYAVEPLQIENCLHETLVLLNSIMGPSLMFKRHFLSPTSLNSLLFVLHYGSVRTRRLVINLLLRLLPALTPDETENMLSDEVKGLIASMNVGVPDSTARRQRRMPDSIIKLLMCGVRRAVAIQQDGNNLGVFHNSCGIDALKEPTTGLLPYGYGNNVLVAADQNISLIQKLFAAPTWTELIACNITDTLRVAHEKIEAFNAGQNQVLECDLLLNAAAACAVLSGFEIVRQGCKITTEDNAVGYVVSLDYFNQTVQVVFMDSLAANNYGVETINIAKIKPKTDAIDVDLSRLSQPLLSTLTGVIKELLLWLNTVGTKLLAASASSSTGCKTSISHHTIHSSFSATTRVDKCLFRLNSVASASLAYLLEHQGDFCLESVDSSIVQSIISISLLPTCMTYLPESSELNGVWNFVQSRKLERVDTTNSDALPNGSTVSAPSSPVTRTVDAYADESISSEPVIAVTDSVVAEADGAGFFLPYSSEYRASRQNMAKKLSSDFGLDETFCLQRLEYFMNDEAATRANLSTVKEVETASGTDAPVDTSEDNVMLSKVVMSDENPLRNIDDPSIVWDSAEYDNFNTFSDFERELMRIIYKDNDVAESAASTAKSTQLEYGSLLVESALEGPNAIATGGKCGRCLHEGEAQNEMVMSLYDESRGLPYCDLVQTSSMRLVNSIYGQKQDVKSLSNFMSQLDMSLTILRTRGIASRLLLDGNVNLLHDAESLDSWVKLLKLVTINEKSVVNSTDTSNLTTKKGLSSLCNALLARASSSVADPSAGTLESSMVDILVNDVVQGFKSLTHSSFSTLTRDTKPTDDSNYTFASPHPYIAPLVTAGKIDIPAEWRGVLVTFSPKCSTASNLAKLNFFKSEKDFQSGKCLHSFWGDHLSSGGDNSFHSFTLTRETLPSSLYYSFQAFPGSEKPVLNMTSSNPSVQVEESSIKAVVRGARGLGDADTLFNLFDESDSQSSDSASVVSYNIVAECEGVSSGTWFFEIVLDNVTSSSEDDRLATRVGLVDLVSYQNDDMQATGIGTIAESIALDLCGRLHYTTGENHDETVAFSTHRHDERVMVTPQTVAFSTYRNGDVLGCMFEVSRDMVTLTFAKNGDWTHSLQEKFRLPATDLTFERRYAPGVSITTNVTVTYNYGLSPFQHPPDMGVSWEPFLARPVSSDNSVVAWGYQFSIQPLNDLYMKVNREFTLITSLKAENSAGSPENENIWIWRSKAAAEFCSCGDVVTLSNRPPRGSIIFDKSQCKPATKFIKIFHSSKLNITVWRPVPAQGFVALGDVVTTGSSSPLPEHLYCVPEFAVAECLMGKRIYCSKKGGDTKLSSISMWSVGNQLGTFFASSSEQLQAGPGEDVHGVGKPYMLRYRHLGIISGEWSDELEVLSLPSLSWSFSLLNFLLDSHVTKPKALTPTVFSHIIQFIRSNASPAPLQGIPILIKVIRTAQMAGVVLPLEQINGLCSVIMQKAVGKVNTEKGLPVSDSLVRLVDLVVEVNSIQVIESNAKKGGDEVPDIAAIPSFIDPTDDSQQRPVALQLLPVHNTQWWDRSTLNPVKVEVSRLISADKVDCLFTKEPILRRLKQILNFFAAIGADRFQNPVDGVRVSYSYPRLMLAKLWFDHFSNCVIDESAHPYRFLMSKKKVSFPSASKLVITFDKRCSLGPNAALLIEYVSNGVVIVETVKGIFGDDSKYSNGLVIPCSEFEVSFTANDEDGRLDGDINPSNDWGWAYLVTASGPIYESVSSACELNTDLFAGISSYQESSAESDVVCHLCAEPTTNGSFCRSCVLQVRILTDKGVDEGKEEKKKEQKSETAGLSSLDAVEEKLFLKCIQAAGVEVKQGTFVVPHASELDIVIERPNPKSYADANKDDVDLALVIRAHSVSESVSDVSTQVIPVPKLTDNSVSVRVVGDRFTYHVMALPRSYVPNLLKRVCAQADELLAADRPTEKTVLDESTPQADAKEVIPEFLGEEAVEDPLMSEFWACNICTCFNPNYLEECSACMNPRSGESPDAQAPGAGWWCQHCTYINPLSTPNCSMCSLPRGDDADAKAQSDDEVEPLRTSSRDPVLTPVPSHGLTRTDSRSGKSGVGDTGESYEKIQLKKTVTNSKSDVVLLTVKGKMSQKGKFETRLEGAIGSGLIPTPYALQAAMRNWTREADTKLLEYINSLLTSSGSSWLSPEHRYIPKSFYSFRGSALYPLGLRDVQARILVLEAFNKGVEDLLPILNTRNADADSVGHMVRKFNGYIFMTLKIPLLEKAIIHTAASSGPGIPASLSLDNFRALASRDKSEKDVSTSNCCFVQAFRQLQHRDSAVYRHVFSTDRVFQINFVGESGIDAGGVFREGISRVIEDLFSDNFNLLLLCPNGQHGIHTNLDKFIPNPQHTGPLALQMFEFVGRLMGMSLRAKLCLPFEFPSMVWKGLLGDEVTVEDLREVDFLTVGLIEAVRSCEKDDIRDQDAFQAKYDDKLRFVYNGSDGVEKEIKSGSGSRVVTYENREEFCDAVLSHRLREFDKQVAAIERGLSEVISTRVLQLFSWQQLEILVAGNPIFDIELWKSKTESHVSAKTLALFWKVMEGFTPKEQAGFIRFAWGRSRLPAPKDFTVKMRLTSAGSSALPQAHTCFFHVELPEYPTEDEMRHGLLTAIHYGVGGILNG